jgi:aminoglycoside 3-N-acetyltransferase
MNNIISKQSILIDLRNIGIEKGDIILINADLFKVGYFNKNKSITLNDWINIFSEAVGNEGSFITVAFTKSFFRFKNKNLIFTRFSSSTSGSLSNAMINNKLAIRSRHPTNSFIGIGRDVKELLQNHNEKSMSYEVIGKIIEKKGKFLLLGTVDKKNAPQAFHYVQENLGYTKYSPYKWLMKTYYEDLDGNKKSFTRKDFGGCSSGGYHLLGSLIIEDAIKFGYVGNAKSALMDAHESFEIIYKELKRNKSLILCGNKDCVNCYGNFFYNGLGAVIFYIKKVFSLFINNILRK